MEFVYSANTGGVIVKAEDGEGLTEQQVQAIATLKLANALEYVGNKLGEMTTKLANTFGT
jgi:hypothetical protein